MTRKKFLVMNNKGYMTIENKPEKKAMLTDVYIARHLQKKETLGVFAGNVYTKFICFDIDVKDSEMAKWVVYKLVNTLQNVGVSGEYIHISESGSKGYHAEIFFDDTITNNKAKKFFDYVITQAELDEVSLKGIGKVEFSPTATQGVKIPLGKHFKTGRTCWYCDFDKGLQPINKSSYILAIKPMEKSSFERIIDEIDGISFSESDIASIEYIESNFKPPGKYFDNTDTETTIESVEKLINEGLSVEGTRHNSLVKISKYYKYCGMSASENEKALIEWLKMQKNEYYLSTWDTCLKDIRGIVEWIYNNNVSLTISKKILISRSEMKQILKAKGKNEKLMLFTLLVHKKRYANKEGVFFMAFSTMTELTRLTEKTVISNIQKLEATNMIEVTRGSKKYVNGKWQQETNKYRVNITKSSQDNNQVYELSLETKSNNYKMNFKNCMLTLFPKVELKKLLTRREYEYLVA